MLTATATRVLADPPPTTAEEIGGLKFDRYLRGGLLCCRAWRPMAVKPFANYRFVTTAAREDWIARTVADFAGHRARIAQRAEQRKADAAKMAEQLQPGTVLHYSWGYDQTNCEFYQVIERRGSVVILRAIGTEQTDQATGGSMSAMLRPLPGQFAGEAFRAKIGPGGAIMKFGCASPTDPAKSHYSSWYA